MKGKCSVCNQEMNLYTRYSRSGKLNKDAFRTCIKCFKAVKTKQPMRPVKDSENNIITSFIETILEECNTSNSRIDNEG